MTDDDEDDYEDFGGGNRLLGFMFGNVDDSGDLDADYLDAVILPAFCLFSTNGVEICVMPRTYLINLM